MSGFFTTTETSIDAVIEHGSSQLSILTISVDGAGLISDLQFGLVPLRPRAEVGLEPLQLPAPTGPSPVGTDTIVTSGDDSAGRTVPVQVWYPAEAAGTELMAPYAPTATGSDLAQQLGLPEEDIALIETGATMSPPIERDRGKLPIVLFAPGFGVPRVLYSALATELASHGYLVAVLDHPGRRQRRRVSRRHSRSRLTRAIVARRPRRTRDPGRRRRRSRGSPHPARLRMASNFYGALDLDHIAFAGHSIGGTCAAEAMRLDARYDVGASLDGSMSDEVLRTGLDRPFLLMGTPEQAESWAMFQASNPATVLVRVEGLGHMSFSDWPALSTLRPVGDVGVDQIGTVDPTRAMAIERTYLLAFLDMHLRGKQSSLLDQQSSTYPEVTVG